MAPVRVRFAPSPTGFMHLGNVRAALMNFLFAKQRNGTFILRIEDTDENRNLEEAKQRIFEDLAWLELSYDEGPLIGGSTGPYEQSKRKNFYDESLNKLVTMNRVYRCFCTPEELDIKRKEQLAVGKPPRYTRACLSLSSKEVEDKINASIPFIWRFKIDESKRLEINTLNHSTISFNMEHFSDFAISRNDGSFTFIFVNFIDDWLMNISHVIRGEDHLSNTALQAALYDAFKIPMPVFWHLPIICNSKGEKLSKRDFGFSLTDLRNGGFIHEAITNYLAIIGISVSEDMQSLNSLIQSINFEKISLHGGIHYDIEKLTWFNQKWLNKISLDDFITRATPYIEKTFGKLIMNTQLKHVFKLIQPESQTLIEVPALIAFFLKKPEYKFESLYEIVTHENVSKIKNILQNINFEDGAEKILESIKTHAKKVGLQTKELLTTLRFLITGKTKGLGVADLFSIVDKKTLEERLKIR